MRVFALQILLVLCFQVQLGAQEWQWAKGFGVDGEYESTKFHQVIASSDTTFLVLGSCQSRKPVYFDEYVITPSGKKTWFLALISSNGNILWLRTLPWSEHRELSIMEISVYDGHIYATGLFRDIFIIIDNDTILNRGNQDAIIIKLDDHGNVISYKCFASPGDDFISKFHIDYKGNIYLSYKVLSESEGRFIKLDSSLETIWELTTNGYLMNTVSNENGNVYAIFNMTGSFYFDDRFFHVEPDTQKVYRIRLEESGQVISVHQDKQGAMYDNQTMLKWSGENLFQAEVVSDQYYGTLLVISCYDKLFRKLWSFSSEPDISEVMGAKPTGLDIDSVGNIIIVGSFNGLMKWNGRSFRSEVGESGHGFYGDIFLLSINQLGKLNYFFKTGKGFYEEPTGIVKLGNNQYVMLGFYQSDTILFGDHKLLNPSPVIEYRAGHNVWVRLKSPYAFISLFKNIDLSDETPVKRDVLIYPNPSSDKIFLYVKDQGTNNPINILIFSTNAKLLKSQLLTSIGSETAIDISDLPQGVYILQYSNSQTQGAQRFVKY